MQNSLKTDDDLPEITDWSPCRVRDGKFVEPCQPLAKACDGVLHGRPGLRLVQWANFRTGEPTRSFITLRSGSLTRRCGIVVNHCPFCGVDICDPVRNENELHASLTAETAEKGDVT